jgi:hypothetical protein
MRSRNSRFKERQTRQLAQACEAKLDVAGALIEFENGSLSRIKTIELFQILVNTGQAWTLQGSYGRQAKALIDQGLVTAKE